MESNVSRGLVLTRRGEREPALSGIMTRQGWARSFNQWRFRADERVRTPFPTLLKKFSRYPFCSKKSFFTSSILTRAVLGRSEAPALRSLSPGGIALEGTRSGDEEAESLDRGGKCHLLSVFSCCFFFFRTTRTARGSFKTNTKTARLRVAAQGKSGQAANVCGSDRSADAARREVAGRVGRESTHQENL